MVITELLILLETSWLCLGILQPILWHVAKIIYIYIYDDIAELVDTWPGHSFLFFSSVEILM